MMTTSTQWQLANEAAERYQNILTPAILGPFAEALVDFAALQDGENVVDVGCGTGAAARYAAEAVGVAGRVMGVDINTSMLAVARSLPAVHGAPIAWREASITHLPFDDNSVDVVLCAQTLQFIPEKVIGLAEMRRVVKPSGRVAVSLWCPLEESPYFYTLVETIARHIGPETAVGLQSAFALSDADEIYGLIEAAGFEQIEMTVRQLDLPLPHLTEFTPRHISATPMAAGFNRADPVIRQQIVHEVTEQLSEYTINGRAAIPFKSHVIMGKR
ncbi:MAG: methyltransferase domain-containing protein [Anaerolineae bacterium]|nr:methyltransferase domain-containing protein [Anaerolineae bacterium]